MSFDSITRFSY